MNDIFTIELPASVTRNQIKEIESEIKQDGGSEIEDAGTTDARSIDPATIQLWVQAGAGVLSLAATAVPLIEKIVGMIRGKGIKGAKITFAGGTTISVDEASAGDLEKLLKATGQPATGQPE